MIEELKTWVWRCQKCPKTSKIIRSTKKPTAPPVNWKRLVERHCDDWRCTTYVDVDLCPNCAGEK